MMLVHPSKKSVIVALLAVLVGAWAVYPTIRCYQQEHYLLDGRASCFLPIVFREDTEYALGYSTAAFQKVRLGMTKDEVVALLGPPLDRWPVPGAEESMRWSRTPGDRSYRKRVVIFANERASEVIHYFYVD